jgi:activator of HSP90 ATPase
MSQELHMDTLISATPERVYAAWLDSAAHGAMTGSPAEIDPRTGGNFSAWDGYIRGATLEFDPPRRILQAWRTTEFAEDDPDSLLEVLFAAEGSSTRLILHHTHIPAGQEEGYRQGWEEFYFQPMQEYFSA